MTVRRDSGTCSPGTARRSPGPSGTCPGRGIQPRWRADPHRLRRRPIPALGHGDHQPAGVSLEQRVEAGFSQPPSVPMVSLRSPAMKAARSGSGTPGPGNRWENPYDMRSRSCRDIQSGRQHDPRRDLDAAPPALRCGHGKTGRWPARAQAWFRSPWPSAPNGKRMLTGGDDGFAWQWDTRTGQILGKPMVTKSVPVGGVAFGPDGKTIAIVVNTEVRVYNTAAPTPPGVALEAPKRHCRVGLTAPMEKRFRRPVTTARYGSGRSPPASRWDCH